MVAGMVTAVVILEQVLQDDGDVATEIVLFLRRLFDRCPRYRRHRQLPLIVGRQQQGVNGGIAGGAAVLFSFPTLLSLTGLFVDFFFPHFIILF